MEEGENEKNKDVVRCIGPSVTQTECMKGAKNEVKEA